MYDKNNYNVVISLQLIKINERKNKSRHYFANNNNNNKKKKKNESQRADLQQPKWNENQTVPATAIHTPDRDVGPLESAAAGRWSLGTAEQ